MFWKWLLELRSHNLDSSGSWRLGDGIVLTDTATGHLARVQVISSSQPGRAPWEEALRERVDDWVHQGPPGPGGAWSMGVGAWFTPEGSVLNFSMLNMAPAG